MSKLAYQPLIVENQFLLEDGFYVPSLLIKDLAT